MQPSSLTPLEEVILNFLEELTHQAEIGDISEVVIFIKQYIFNCYLVYLDFSSFTIYFIFFIFMRFYHPINFAYN